MVHSLIVRLEVRHCTGGTQKAQKETQEAQKVELKTEKLSCAFVVSFVPFVVYKIKIKQEAGLLPSPVENHSWQAYAVNEEPQPQLPVAFGFLNVKPEPMTPLT